MASDEEGMTTGKKVVAGAALGVAIPAAVGVAKKLIGNDDESDDESASSQSRPRRKTGSSSSRPRTSSST